MKKPEPKDYGYEDGGIETPRGWSIEGGEEAYNDAVKTFDNFMNQISPDDVTEKPNENEFIESNKAFDKKIELLKINESEMKQIASNFLAGDEFTHGFPDDWDDCVEIVAKFGMYIKNILK